MRFSNYFSCLIILLMLGCKKDFSPKPNISDNTKVNRKKFITKYKFDQFPVKKIETEKKVKSLNTNQTSYSKHFRTKIMRGFTEPINFAGKYIISYWGCGSPCHIGVLINTENGIIDEIPSASLRYKFKKNSRLLIVNIPDSLDYYISESVYEPEIYYLDTIQNKFIKLYE